MSKEYITTDFHTIYRVLIYEDDYRIDVTIDENFGERVITYMLFRDGYEKIFMSTVGGYYVSLPITDDLVNTLLDIMQDILSKSVVMAGREIHE